MSIFTWMLIACVAMCVIMALGVIFDSKTWDSPEHVGLFVFRHKWVGVICIPMLFLVPLCIVFYALFVPMGIENMFLQLVARVLSGIGLGMAGMSIFILSMLIFFGLKYLCQPRKKVGIAEA